jgi:hypothetical protein
MSYGINHQIGVALLHPSVTMPKSPLADHDACIATIEIPASAERIFSGIDHSGERNLVGIAGHKLHCED